MVSERDKHAGYAKRALRLDIFDAFQYVTDVFIGRLDSELKPSDIYAILEEHWGQRMATEYCEWFAANYEEGDWE